MLLPRQLDGLVQSRCVAETHASRRRDVYQFEHMQVHEYTALMERVELEEDYKRRMVIVDGLHVEVS